METIKNYLESMFANLPNTEEVKRAKEELLQMMEDKYNELVEEGHSSNSAIGTVISEFGNLEELSEDLGISKEVQEVENVNKKVLSMEEIKNYIKSQGKHAFYIALGVFFCIFSLVFPIVSEVLQFNYSESIGVSLMFVSIAAGVFCFVYSASVNKKWDYLHTESCYVDYSSVNWIKEQQEQYRGTAALQKTLGIVFCVLCFVPAIVFEEIKGFSFNFEELGGACLFAFVAIGVFLIVYSSNRMGVYNKLLDLNDSETISGNYKKEKRGEKEIHYKNEMVETIMSVYWPTLTCIYLSWSFLTFDWHITWVVWVFGALIQTVINTIFEEK